MPRKKTHRPTDAELAILRVLWTQGPSKVRQVQEALNEDAGEETGYTTVLKLLQIMTEKDLVVRDESQRAHVYTAHHSEDQTQRGLVGDLLDRAFDGSATQMVLQALHSRPASAEERAEIRRLLDHMDQDDSGSHRS